MPVLPRLSSLNQSTRFHGSSGAPGRPSGMGPYICWRWSRDIGALDLDDLRAKGDKGLRRDRAGDILGDVEHPHAFER